jgi:excisionase family DNA binding protein
MNDEATHTQESILENEVLTVKEVAVYLRVSRVTVWRWCQRGTLPALRVGRNWRIYRDDLLNLLERSQPLNSVPLEASPTSKNDRCVQTLPVVAEESADCVEDSFESELDNPDSCR